MIRFVLFIIFWAMPAAAQDFSALARLDPAQSQVVDTADGVAVTLGLSQTVPFRVFTLDAPRRVILDFQEVDWGTTRPEGLLNADAIAALRFGRMQPGWSRMVLDLVVPMEIKTAGMSVDQDSGRAVVELTLVPTDAARFQATAGAPDGAQWDVNPAVTRPTARAALRVVIDPGHGGIDPGAEHGGQREADLMLALGIEVSEALRRAGIDAILTRDADVFVPLDRRVSIARQAGADLMISLHADALEADQASGASVYTLSQTGVDGAAQRMAERHERGDLLAGLDLSQQDDKVATVLMELARQDTGPQADRFADTLVNTLRGAEAQVNSRPRRNGKLAVLIAADFASVLLEVGFLTNARDRERLSSQAGRAPLVTGILRAVQQWSVDEAARAPLVRQ